MPYYDPTLATLVGIAAFGWIGMIVTSVIVYWNWGTRRRQT